MVFMGIRGGPSRSADLGLCLPFTTLHSNSDLTAVLGPNAGATTSGWTSMRYAASFVLGVAMTALHVPDGGTTGALVHHWCVPLLLLTRRA